LPSSQQIGSAAEDRACRYLQQQGLKLLQRNFRGPRGELDLVMQDRKQLVFVEVRYRRQQRFGSGADSVTAGKRDKLVKTALYYLQCHPDQARLANRFDVVSISQGPGGEEIDWIQNAFLAEE